MPSMPALVAEYAVRVARPSAAREDSSTTRPKCAARIAGSAACTSWIAQPRCRSTSASRSSSLPRRAAPGGSRRRCGSPWSSCGKRATSSRAACAVAARSAEIDLEAVQARVRDVRLAPRQRHDLVAAASRSSQIALPMPAEPPVTAAIVVRQRSACGLCVRGTRARLSAGMPLTPSSTSASTRKGSRCPSRSSAAGTEHRAGER